MRARLLLLAAPASTVRAEPQPVPVRVPGLDHAAGAALLLPGHWFAGARRGPGAGAAIEWEVFDNAHHGFDGSAPLRLRRDVPGGVHPGQGVHVGAEPQARAAAAVRLERFLKVNWSLAP